MTTMQPAAVGEDDAFGHHHGHGQWSQAIEDYLKRIWLIAPDGPPVQGNELARTLGVSHASVTGMLQRLGDLGLVEYVRYQGATLTEQGRRIAIEVVRHHRLIEAYLAEVLGMPWEHVHDEAEILEHHISPRMEQLMAAQLGHPKFDPHGHPIPAEDGSLPERAHGLRALDSLEDGERATVRAVRNEHRELLSYLTQIGVRPGSVVSVARRAPLGGPLTIQNESGERHAIALETATSIDVDG
jgi:DtxR family transcriptional regulator, Mn-dependent transcriptional regulator